MDRAEKQQLVDGLSDNFRKSQVALCADYRGLTVEEINLLRRSLKEGGAFGMVVKNTLARISAKKVLGENGSPEVDKFLSTLEGPSLLVFSYDDPVAPAKAITNFIKEKKKLVVKGGWMEGAFLDESGVQALSEMPSREEVLAKLLNVILAPATQLVRTINEPGSRVARVLGAYQRKLEGAAS